MFGPACSAKIHECNMRNYSIFRYHDMLFAYFEYIGDDFEGDMAKVAADETTQEWWAVCGPMQTPVEDAPRANGGRRLKRSFHTD